MKATTELSIIMPEEQMRMVYLVNAVNWQRRGGVQRIVALEDRITSLESGVEAAKTALAQLKCNKEIAEKEDPSSKKVESSRLNDASLMFPQTWIALYIEDRLAPLLDETSSTASEEDSLKTKELLVSIEFLTIIRELEQIARELGKTVACRLGNDVSTDITNEEGHPMDLEQNESICKLLMDLKQNEQQLNEKILKLEQENKNLSEQCEMSIQTETKLHNEKKMLEEITAVLQKETIGLQKGIQDLEKEHHKLTMQLKDQMNQMKAEESSWKEEQNRLLTLNKNLSEQKDMLLENSIKTEIELKKEKKLLEERSAELQGIQDLEKNLPYGNPIPDSPLQKLTNKLSTTMKQIIAPNGKVTAEELGTLMGSFVSSTAYMVTSANSDIKYTALSGFAAVISQVIGAMFNNVVKHITTVENIKWKATTVKTLTSVPWIFLGGLLPTVVGGFIQSWKLRVIVTGIVTFFMKIIFAGLWTRNYGIPKRRGFWVVALGMLGISLAAGAPQLLKLLAKY